jgi:hypothetical protein
VTTIELDDDEIRALAALFRLIREAQHPDGESTRIYIGHPALGSAVKKIEVADAAAIKQAEARLRARVHEPRGQSKYAVESAQTEPPADVVVTEIPGGDE